KATSFPFETFEAALLGGLGEVKPHEVLGEEDGPDEVMALSGRLATIQTRLAALAEDLDTDGPSPTLTAAIRKKEAEQAEVQRELAAARQRAAHPLSEAWGEAKTLLRAVRGAEDRQDALLRLRAALRNVVDAVYVLVVPRGRDRLAAVQVYFKGER